MDQQQYKSKSSVILNTLYNLGGHFFVTLFSVILVPVIIRRAGTEIYALWAIAALIDAASNILTLMFEYVCEKFLPDYLVKNQKNKIDIFLSTGIFFNILTFVAAAPLTLMLLPALTALLKIPPHLKNDALFLFRGAVIIYFFKSAFVMLKGLQRGVQRMDVENRITVLFFTARGIGLVTALSLGYGIRGMVVAEGIAVLLNVAVNWIMAFRLLKGLRISPMLFDYKILCKTISFGIRLINCNIAGVALFQTDKLFISHYIGIAKVAVYQVGFNLATVLQNKLQMVTSAIYPFSAALHGDNEREKLLNLYKRGSKYNNIIQFPLWVLLFGLADRVLYVWLGPGFEDGADITRILIPALAISIINEVGIRTSIGMGRPELFNNYSAILMALNLPLTFYLVQRAGYRGAAIASSVSYVAASIYFSLKYHRIYKVPFDGEYIQNILAPLTASLLVAIPLYPAILHLGQSSSRISVFIFIAASSAVYLSIYALVLLKSGIIDPVDRNFLRENLFTGKLKFMARFL